MAKPTPSLSPIPLLDALAARTPRTCVFRATSAGQARAWQKRARRALAKCLGFLDQERTPLQPKVLRTVDRGAYVRQEVLLQPSPGALLPVYVLVPKRAARPLPCVLALHGHGYGVKDIVGLWEDGSERYTPDGYHKDFACTLAERGFLVAAPEISCFGQRQHDYHYLDGTGAGAPSTCHHASTYAFMLGVSVAGLRVWEGLRVVDYLETRPEADVSRLGAMGISGGGMHTFFSTAIDQRTKACVISGYFCDWRQSILAMNHCTCNFVPGLYGLGELSDLAGLIAPRPCLVENGDHDPIFPIAAVKASVERARRAWRALGASERLETDYFEGRHQISGARAYDFLAANL